MQIRELTETQTQALAGALKDELTNTDITDAARLADATECDTRSRSGKEARLIEFLHQANHSKDLQSVLSALITQADIRQNPDLVEELNDILAGSSVIIENTTDGYALTTKTTGYAKRIEEEHHTFLENKAPTRVIARLDRANVLLAEGDYDNALQDCRRALENLTVSGQYGWALEELHDSGLIQKDTSEGDQKSKDREIAKDAFNYLSNIGSHAGANSPPANERQAELGFIYTVEVIVFLLRAIEDGRRNGIELDRWVV